MWKRLLLMASLAAAPAWAHEGDELATNDLHASATAEGNRVEASAAVPGAVAALKEHLYRLERWPALFSDVRAVARQPAGTWAVDFRRFGHPHDFRVERTPAGLVFRLAAEGHGDGRLEYALEPIDAARSKLTVRFVIPTPPQMTQQQMLDLLRGKARADLDDFARVMERKDHE